MSNKDHIDRVAERIAPAILSFREKIGTNRSFHADTLHNYVNGWIGTTIAPASADRILRLLRQRGDLAYVVLDRRASLYQFTQFGNAVPTPPSVLSAAASGDFQRQLAELAV